MYVARRLPHFVSAEQLVNGLILQNNNNNNNNNNNKIEPDAAKRHKDVPGGNNNAKHQSKEASLQMRMFNSAIQMFEIPFEDLTTVILSKNNCLKRRWHEASHGDGNGDANGDANGGDGDEEEERDKKKDELSANGLKLVLDELMRFGLIDGKLKGEIMDDMATMPNPRPGTSVMMHKRIIDNLRGCTVINSRVKREVELIIKAHVYDDEIEGRKKFWLTYLGNSGGGGGGGAGGLQIKNEVNMIFNALCRLSTVLTPIQLMHDVLSIHESGPSASASAASIRLSHFFDLFKSQEDQEAMSSIAKNVALELSIWFQMFLAMGEHAAIRLFPALIACESTKRQADNDTTVVIKIKIKTNAKEAIQRWLDCSAKVATPATCFDAMWKNEDMQKDHRGELLEIKEAIKKGTMKRREIFAMIKKVTEAMA